MPKKHPKKRFGMKHDPVSPSSVIVKEEELCPESSTSKMPSLITTAVEKLSSVTSEERECGCNMISTVAEQSGAIDLLLRQNVIRILGPLVKDDSMTVRQAALGALRNISVDGSMDVCERMVQLDAMTPLVALLKEYGPEWTPESMKSLDTNIYIQAVHLLWNLCESSETAVKIFNQELLASGLIPKLNPLLYTYNIAIPTAHCLQAVSEENTDIESMTALQTIVPSLLNQSEQSDSLEHVVMKALLIGILHNCTGGSLRGGHGSLVAPVVEHVADILSRDIASLVDDLLHQCSSLDASSGAGAALCDSAEMHDDVSEMAAGNGSGDSASSTEKKVNGNVDSKDTGSAASEKKINKNVQLARSRLDNIMTAKELAFELVSNLCCTDDDSEGWEDSVNDDSSDMEDDMNVKQEYDDVTNPLCVPSEIHALLLSHHILDHVINGCQISGIGLQLGRLPDPEKTQKRLGKLQGRALMCLSNMAATMDMDDLGGHQGVLDVWKSLTRLVLSQQVKSDDMLLESVTSCIRAIAQKLSEINSPFFQDVSECDLQFLYQLAHQSGNKNIRIHTVRTVAAIGCMLAKQIPPHTMMKPIGVFLLVICMKDSDAIVIAETLDAIFDVFSEDHLDPLAVDIQLVPKLKQLAPIFKNKIKQQKSRYRDQMAVISSARTNLARFIKYKNG